MGSFLRKFPTLGVEDSYEFDTYIRNLASSSDRVRHVVIISVVASVLVFAAHRRSAPEGWWNERLQLAHVVANHKLSEADLPSKSAQVQSLTAEYNTMSVKEIENELSACSLLNPKVKNLRCRQVAALYWLQGKAHSPGTFSHYLDEVEKTNVSEVLWVEVPFLGIKFDINDMGTFSAIGLSIISVMLLYSIARHHENLYLCLWQVRRVAEADRRYNDGQSRANFLYHAMAMTQVLSRPPTLARWADRGRSRVIPMFLFFVPVLVQGLVFQNDMKTESVGKLYSTSLANQTFLLHLFFGIALVLMTVFVLAFSRASEVRWRNTFFEINPSYKNIKPVGYLTWLIPRDHRRYRFVHDEALRGEYGFFLVELHERKIVNIGVPSSGEIKNGRGNWQTAEHVDDWYFNPLFQDNGLLYEANGGPDEAALSVNVRSREDELQDGQWVIRRAAVLRTYPLTLIEAVGEKLIRFEHGQIARTICSINDPKNSAASSQRGIIDVAAQLGPSGEELIVFADRMSRYLKIVEAGNVNFFEPSVIGKDGRPKLSRWTPVAVSCRDGKVFVAEKEKRVFFRAEKVRVRIIDPSSREEVGCVSLE